MATVSGDVVAITERKTNSTFSIAEDSTWRAIECANCGSPQLVTIAMTSDGLYEWLRCPACRQGAVSNRGVVLPASTGLRNPKGQPPEDQYVWDEIRGCMSVSAYNAAVMLCRKLLFHLAVTHGLPAKNSQGRAPTFDQAVRHLQTAGFISQRMTPWVDRIREIGNEANHEIPQISREDAETVAKFTQQLLLMIYEYPLDLAESSPLQDEAGPEE
jgi:hypothetical protein